MTKVGSERVRCGQVDGVEGANVMRLQQTGRVENALVHLDKLDPGEHGPAPLDALVAFSE